MTQNTYDGPTWKNPTTLALVAVIIAGVIFSATAITNARREAAYQADQARIARILGRAGQRDYLILLCEADHANEATFFTPSGGWGIGPMPRGKLVNADVGMIREGSRPMTAEELRLVKEFGLDDTGGITSDLQLCYFNLADDGTATAVPFGRDRKSSGPP